MEPGLQVGEERRQAGDRGAQVQPGRGHGDDEQGDLVWPAAAGLLPALDALWVAALALDALGTQAPRTLGVTREAPAAFGVGRALSRRPGKASHLEHTVSHFWLGPTMPRCMQWLSTQQAILLVPKH